MLRRVRASRAEAGSPLRQEPPAPPEPPRADPADRAGHVGSPGPALGRGARARRRALRVAAEVRSSVQRSAPERPQVLSRGAAREAGTGEADWIADAALGGGAGRARVLAGRDRQARGSGRHPGALMSADEILFQVGDDGIAWLTFNRPEARNAMTFGMYRRLGDICR